MVKGRPPPATRPPPPHADNSNRLWPLPAADYTRILPPLTVVPLKVKDILPKPGEPTVTCIFLARLLFDADRARRWRHGGNCDDWARRDGRRLRRTGWGTYARPWQILAGPETVDPSRPARIADASSSARASAIAIDRGPGGPSRHHVVNSPTRRPGENRRNGTLKEP